MKPKYTLTDMHLFKKINELDTLLWNAQNGKKENSPKIQWDKQYRIQFADTFGNTSIQIIRVRRIADTYNQPEEISVVSSENITKLRELCQSTTLQNVHSRYYTVDSLIKKIFIDFMVEFCAYTRLESHTATKLPSTKTTYTLEDTEKLQKLTELDTLLFKGVNNHKVIDSSVSWNSRFFIQLKSDNKLYLTTLEITFDPENTPTKSVPLDTELVTKIREICYETTLSTVDYGYSDIDNLFNKAFMNAVNMHTIITD